MGLQGEDIFTTQPLGMWLQGTCPGKKIPCWEESRSGAGWRRWSHSCWALEPLLPPLTQRHLQWEHWLSSRFPLGVYLGLPASIQSEKSFAAVDVGLHWAFWRGRKEEGLVWPLALRIEVITVIRNRGNQKRAEAHQRIGQKLLSSSIGTKGGNTAITPVVSQVWPQQGIASPTVLLCACTINRCCPDWPKQLHVFPWD